MDLNLKNKVVLVAGSSRGIGQAICKAFAREGARVVVTGRHAKDVDALVDEISGSGGSALGFTGDLEQEQDIAACVEMIIKRWDRLDVVVANIGSGQGIRGWSAPEEEWSRLMGLNFLSSTRLVRRTVPEIKRHDGGSIVMISSIAGMEHVGAPMPYEIAKSAVIAASKYFARTLAEHGIRVNVVAPGNIIFPGSVWEEKVRTDEPGVISMLNREVPMKRLGHPEEVAAAVLFLASSQASFISGACLTVDGGQTRSLR